MRLRFWGRPSPDELYRRSVERQAHVVALVKESKCPSCGDALNVVGYENNHGLTHYEVAVVCEKCKSRFLFTEKGIKGEYSKP